MKKAATLGLVCLLVLVCALPAQAAKARNILTDSDSVYHANHLQQHLGTTSCICTGDYVGMRSSSSGSTVVGHLEQADRFTLLQLDGQQALVLVTDSASTSPDSSNGLTGWVNADYVDCTCTAAQYAGSGASGAQPFNGVPAEWVHASGAGAWSTTLTLKSDGSFTGYFSDSEMGVFAPEYPNGTLYEATFSGQFTDLQQIDGYTYAMTLSTLALSEPEGTSFIEDGILHVVTLPAGLESGDLFYLYLPGTPENALPAAYISWLLFYNSGPLPGYGLYNVTQERGFMTSTEYFGN